MKNSAAPAVFIVDDDVGGRRAVAVVAMKEGANDLLAKPFESGVYTAAVDHALEKSRDTKRKALDRQPAAT